MKQIPRLARQKILEALKVSPVIFVSGPRQAGKSTLVQDLSQAEFPAEYVSFDNATQMAAATRAPYEYLTQRHGPLIIDEVQLVQELFRSLKIVVDERRKNKKNSANGRYLLTGSANIMALPKLSDPLVGRMIVTPLYPLSVAEVTGGSGSGIDLLFAQDFSSLKNPKISCAEAVQLAIFPEISGKDAHLRSLWFEGYITTLLQRDVKLLADIEKMAYIPTLLRLLAARSGSLINDADLARSLGLNAVTTKHYRILLQMMFLAFDTPPWFRNLTKRLVKSPKGYLIDTLHLCHLLDYSIEELPAKRPDLYGHVIENFMASEILKVLSFGKTRAKLMHFRTNDGKEVDFILERPNGTLVGIEVKVTGNNVTDTDFKGLQELRMHVKSDFICGVVLYPGNEVVPFGDNLGTPLPPSLAIKLDFPSQTSSIHLYEG